MFCFYLECDDSTQVEDLWYDKVIMPNQQGDRPDAPEFAGGQCHLILAAVKCNSTPPRVMILTEESRTRRKIDFKGLHFVKNLLTNIIQ